VATVMPEPTGRPASGRDWLKVVLVQLAALLVLIGCRLGWLGTAAEAVKAQRAGIGDDNVGLKVEKVRVQYYAGSNTFGASCYTEVANAAANGTTETQRCGCVASRSLSTRTKRDLPIPGSPLNMTTCPSPCTTCAQRSVNKRTSCSRPTNGVRPAVAATSRRVLLFRSSWTR
jgi:hypothetical protein